MAFKEIFELITSNSIGIACILYFMYRDYKFMNRLDNMLATLSTQTETIANILINKKEE